MLDLSQLTPELVQSLSLEQRVELMELLERRKLLRARNRLANYSPYPKQLEFHAAGGDPTVRERLFMAGNQLGKTVAGASEFAMHLTGRYPKAWPGKKYPYAIRMIAGSESAELTKKGVQRLLVGPPELQAEWGTGMIPYDSIRDTARRQGVPDALASVTVQHECGDLSVVQFASYDQGRTKWQADTVNEVWFDEEPPEDVYSEGLTRTQATGGGVTVTFTPLLGMSNVVKRFLHDKVQGTHVTNMTIHDALHYTADEVERIVAAYPAHEREARAMGIPMMGSGQVFPVSESGIRIDPFPIPSHWPRLCALDFGWGHPAAAVWLAWDRDTDTIYVYDCWRGSETSVPMQAIIIKGRGVWIPAAWPHDGLQHDKGSGQQLAKQYKDAGVAMLAEHAKFPDGSIGFEAGISAMLTRFQTRQLRVFSTLTDWFGEFRMYHRKDGLVVKIDDDLLSATRVGLMAMRFGKSEIEARGHPMSDIVPMAPVHQPLDAVMGY